MRFSGPTEHARQFHRHAAGYEARLIADADHAAQFRLTLPETQCGMAVTDVSAGGLGLCCSLFLPKNMRVTLRVSAAGEETSGPKVELSVRAVIRSCTMIDHKPTYQIGLQFVDPAGRDERLLVQRATVPSSKDQPAEPAGGVSAA